jgi:hypothetical protein
MKAVSYVFEGETYTDYYCAHHFNLVKGDVGITVTDAPSGASCSECDMRDAEYESDRLAERRNEQVLSGIL